MHSWNKTILINKNVVFNQKQRWLRKFRRAGFNKKKVEVLRLQDELGKQNFHENVKKIYEPLTGTIKNTSEDITKTMMLASKENNEVLENLNDKLSELMNDLI